MRLETVNPLARQQDIESLLLFDNVDEMMHNFALVSPGSRMEVVEAAIALGADGPARHFVPDSPKVLASTPVVLPGKKVTISFDAPEKEGEYPYVCTFPGHGFLMHGILFVAKERPRKMDDLLAKTATETSTQSALANPSNSAVAVVHRTFMPDCSPAAIAVSLPGGHSYCWDAGTCHLRYAWIGGFVDPMPVWKGNGNGLAKIIGNKFYVTPKDFPISTGNDNLHKVQFKGYRKIEGHPEFHYTIDNIDVYERISALPSGMGLMRHFRIPNAKQPIYINFSNGHAEIDLLRNAAPRKISGNRVVKLQANEAKAFTITHRHAHGK